MDDRTTTGPGSSAPTSDGPEAPHPTTDPDRTGPGRMERAAKLVTAAEQRASAEADALEQRVPHLSLIRELWGRYQRQNATVLAGHLAFRSFLFLLPLAVLVVAILGFVNGSVDISNTAHSQLGLGRSLASTVSQSADQAHKGRWALLASGLFALAITGLGFLSALHYCFAQAWGMEPGKLRGKASLLPKFIGSIIIVLLAVVCASVLKRFGLAAGYAGVLGAGLVVTLGFLGVAMVLPHRSVSVRWLVPGSVFAAIGVELLHIFATFYLPAKVARSSSLYGSLGISVSVLFILFLLGNVIVGSALVNAVWWDHFHGPARTTTELDRLPDPPDPDDPTEPAQPSGGSAPAGRGGAPTGGSVEDDHVVAG